MSHEVPKCCQCCGNFHSQADRVRHKECAAFGTTDGVKENRCGYWQPRFDFGARQPDREEKEGAKTTPCDPC